MTICRRWIAFPAVLVFAACSSPRKPETPPAAAAPVYFQVDAATAGAVEGRVTFSGRPPARTAVDMSEDPACVEAHKGKAYDDTLLLGKGGAVANAFVYVKSGLEGKNFAPPATPVVIDQNGCWFHPRVLGIQTGQTLQVTNADPITHNIHPLAQVNREWNHSMGQGDAPLARRFTRPEVMIKVKCNIHSWMRAYLGVLEHPYFAVTGDDGAFAIRNLPPGEYTIAVWQENLGTKEQKITVPPSGKVEAGFAWQGVGQ